MWYQLYVLPFITAFALSLASVLVLIYFSGKGKDVRTGSRHIHRAGISRFGGVAIFIGFFVTLTLDKSLVISEVLRMIILVSFLLVVVGAWDDIRQFGWKIQLFFQVFVASVTYIIGVKVLYITNPFGGVFVFNELTGFIFGILWVLIIMNAMNWLDGIDGASGSVTFIAAITIGLLSLKPEVNQPPVGIVAMAIGGSVLGFLFFNFYPSKILAGTSGALLMGYVLSVLAIYAGTKIATALTVLIIPIVDFVWVIGERLANKVSIFQSDDRHLHHKLMRIGWSQRKILAGYSVTTIFIACGALLFGALGKIAIMLGVSLLMTFIFLWLRKKRYHYSA